MSGIDCTSTMTSQIKHMETRRIQVEGFETGVED